MYSVVVYVVEFVYNVNIYEKVYIMSGWAHTVNWCRIRIKSVLSSHKQTWQSANHIYFEIFCISIDDNVHEGKVWCWFNIRNLFLSFIVGFNSLWPNDTIWRHGSWSTLIQVMACCLTAPSHYLNQYWLIICNVPWRSSDGIIIQTSQDSNQ